MKAFRFRGARLLEWRRAQSDVARVTYLRATESLREATGHLRTAEAAREDAARDLCRSLQETLDAGALARHRNWIDARRAAADACRSVHDERAAAAAVAADGLRDAQRRVKVMERLRDRGARRHAAAVQRSEMKALDELAVQQFVRAQMNGDSRDGR